VWVETQDVLGDTWGRLLSAANGIGGKSLHLGILLWGLGIAVGTLIAERAHTDSGGRNLRTGPPPQVFDGEADAGPRMNHARASELSWRCRYDERRFARGGKNASETTAALRLAIGAER
jgi:hypothetical protein